MNITTDAKLRFERDAFIVWCLDTDRGYRHAAENRWHLVLLSDVLKPRPRWRERQSLDLARAIGVHATLPPVQLEPAPGSKVRVTAPVRLVVRAQDERLPLITDGQVDITYGTVVRAGPLLFSILYLEQVESLGEGRFSLPFVGETTDLCRDEGLEQFTKPFEMRSKKLNIWMALFGASFLLTGAVALGGALSRGAHFCYGNSPMDTVAACVGCVLLTWIVQLAIGLPIHKRVLGWVYSASSGNEKEELDAQSLHR